VFKLNKLTNSVYDIYIKELEGHIGVIKTEDKLLFVDSGAEPHFAEKAREEAENKLGLPVKQLILTHQHWDHVFGNQAFEDCEIISSTCIKKSMEEYLKTIWNEDSLEKFKKEDLEKYGDLRIVLPNKIFEDKYVIQGKNLTVQVIEADGHSLGNCFVFIPEENVLITGDLLFVQMTPYFGDPTADIFSWIEVNRAMLNLKPKVIIPGHGNISDRTGLKNQIRYFENCINWMKKYIKEGNDKESLTLELDFPRLDPIKIEGYDELLLQSMKRTYEIVNEKLKMEKYEKQE